MPERQRSSGPEASGEEARCGLDRRGFLVAAGFSAGALAAGCQRAPVEKAVPFLVQPEEVVPGRPVHYASTCGGCTAGCGVLVKCRDGRPIKLDGNPEHPLSAGGLCAVGQAMLLGVYDSRRLAQPLIGGEPASWEAVDREVFRRLSDVAGRGGRVRLLTETVNSPTEQAWIDRFLASFVDGRQVTYDPLSSSAIAEAHRRTHGVRSVPRYRFERAEVVVGFDADFLGGWISPVEHTAGYRAGRRLDGDPPRLSYHLQVEARMSLTGSNADRRIVVKPGEIGSLLAGLASRLADHAGIAPRGSSAPGEHGAELDRLAERLWHHRGRALVVSASQDVDEQVLVNLINDLLAGYGSTLDVERPSLQRMGDDEQLASLLSELAAGQVDALFVRGVNPLHDLGGGDELAAAIQRVPLVVSFTGERDETSLAAHLVCPDHHFLESWRDAEPVAGLLSVTQPALRPLGATRAFVESLAAWCGEPASARELMRRVWDEQVFPRRKVAADGPEGPSDAESFWQQSVHDGFAAIEPQVPAVPPTFSVDTTAGALARVAGTAAVGRGAGTGADAGSFTLVLHPSLTLLDGRHAGNPWLQELPDPISKVVWDNYAALSPRAARELGVEDGDVVRLSAGGVAVELPALVQPGQHDGVVAVALGYGGEVTRRFADLGPRWVSARATVGADGRVGKNAAPLAPPVAGRRLGVRDGLRVEPTGGSQPLATTQIYQTLAVPAALAPASGELRPIVQETALPAYAADRGAGAPHAHPVGGDLWPEHDYPGRRWGMTVDLNACTGCSACVVACQAENNIPVVGKDEVARRREMSWLRIDRYYLGDGVETGDADPAGVDVAHQPMLCHHCDNAPCESVCPVLATVHSDEGLNQQVYNRCVGTRYCANNCPYKVRRFNWFDYRRDSALENLVLNPDVVVRSRGVMEKCSFCVQRIQEAKHRAASAGRELADGEIQTACQQSCPARAIHFGDVADPASQVAGRIADPRHYRLFEELNVRPSVGYLRRVRHREEGEETHHG